MVSEFEVAAQDIEQEYQVALGELTEQKEKIEGQIKTAARGELSDLERQKESILGEIRRVEEAHKRSAALPSVGPAIIGAAREEKVAREYAAREAAVSVTVGIRRRKSKALSVLDEDYKASIIELGGERERALAAIAKAEAEWNAQHTQLDTGEWVDTEAYEAMEAELQALLMGQGIEAFNQFVAEEAALTGEERFARAVAEGTIPSNATYTGYDAETGTISYNMPYSTGEEAYQALVDAGELPEGAVYTGYDPVTGNISYNIPYATGEEAFQALIASGDVPEGAVYTGYDAETGTVSYSIGGGFTGKELFDQAVAEGLIPGGSTYIGYNKETGEISYSTGVTLSGKEAFQAMVDDGLIPEGAVYTGYDKKTGEVQYTLPLTGLDIFNQMVQEGILPLEATYEGYDASTGTLTYRAPIGPGLSVFPVFHILRTAHYDAETGTTQIIPYGYDSIESFEADNIEGAEGTWISNESFSSLTVAQQQVFKSEGYEALEASMAFVPPELKGNIFGIPVPAWLEAPIAYFGTEAFTEEERKVLGYTLPGLVHYPLVSFFGEGTPLYAAMYEQPMLQAIGTWFLVTTPIVSTIAYWDEMDTAGKAISIALDILTLAPFIPSISRSVFSAVKKIKGIRASIILDQLEVGQLKSTTSALKKLEDLYPEARPQAEKLIEARTAYAEAYKLSLDDPTNLNINKAVELQWKLRRVADDYTTVMKRYIGVDDPAVSVALKDFSADVVHQIQYTVKELLSPAGDIKTLQANVAKAQQAFWDAKAKWPMKPENWMDLAGDLYAAESKLAMAEAGSVSKLLTELVEVRRLLMEGQHPLALPSAIKKLQIREASLLAQIDKAIKSMEVEWGSTGIFGDTRVMDRPTLTKVPGVGGAGPAVVTPQLAAPHLEVPGFIAPTVLPTTVAQLQPLVFPTVVPMTVPAVSPEVSPAISPEIKIAPGVEVETEIAPAIAPEVVITEVVSPKEIEQTLLTEATEVAVKALEQAMPILKVEAMIRSHIEEWVKTHLSEQLKTQAKLQTKTEVMTKTALARALQIPTKTKLKIRPRLRLPSMEPISQAKEAIAAEERGAIAWRQGFVWWVINFPYMGKEDVEVRKTPPPGAKIVTGPKSAFRTIQTLTGVPPKELQLDMGIMDINIKEGKSMGYKRDPRQETKGQITLKGVHL